MEKQPTDHVFSAATERLLLASNKQTGYNNSTRFIFQPKILSAIAAVRLRHKRPDINSIYEHFTKIEGSNTDKEFIEGAILQMI